MLRYVGPDAVGDVRFTVPGTRHARLGTLGTLAAHDAPGTLVIFEALRKLVSGQLGAKWGRIGTKGTVGGGFRQICQGLSTGICCNPGFLCMLLVDEVLYLER